MQTQMPRQQATFRRVATVRGRDQNGSLVIPVEPAVNQSGNAGGDGVQFRRADDLSLVGRIVDNEEITGDAETPIDGRKYELARAINHFGAGETKSVTIPAAGLEHLDVDPADVNEELEFDLWVCVDPDVEHPLIEVTPHVYKEKQTTIEPFVGESE